MRRLLLVLACAAFTGLAANSNAADKPNILFILVDDMGWRDLACYGHEIHETPNIDALAALGMRFTSAYAACPICAPSRAAIMTGKFPSNTGFVDNFASEVRGETLQRSEVSQFLDVKEVTLAEALQGGGYQTGFVGKWHLSVGMEPRLPTDQGFDVNVAGSFWGRPLKGYFSPYQMPNLEDGPEGEYLPDRLTTEAIRVMDGFSKRDKPWLLYMSYYTVHGPFHSKPEKTKKYAAKARQAKVKLKNAAYAGMIESLDENVGRMVEWLEEKGLRKNTIIVFTSDNGGMVKATENRPLRSYKGDIYEGGIRVPCLIDWPDVIKPGSVSDTPVHGSDFYATLLAMAGLPQQPDNHQDSVNLVPLLKGDTDFKRGPMVWHYPVGVPHIPHSKPGSVIRDGDWKFLRFYEDGREELYNLKNDIGETKNLLATMPEKAVELRAQLDAVLKTHHATIPVAVPAKPSPLARTKTTKTNPAISDKVSVAQEISQHDKAYYAENTEECVYTNKSGQTMPYRLFVPKDYDPKKKYPLVFHLHGAGSRGNDNAKHLLPWFAGWMDEGVQKEHPCFILMPQCPAGQQWVNTPWKDGSYTYNRVPISQPLKLAKEVFDKVVAENPIDESRIYAVGLSMGGYGVWNFIMRYPELVAAAVPCCGAGDPSMAYKLKDLPIWAFHGDADEIVPFEGSKDMVDAIKKEGGEKIEFTIYKNFGHQAHRRAWKSKELVEWVFKQKLVK